MLKFLNQIDLSKLFQPSYIFEIAPETNGLYIYLALLFGLMIIAALILWKFWRNFKYKIYNQIRKQKVNLLLTVGIIGEVLVFSRYEQILYLGSRLMLLLLLLVFIVWGAFILYLNLILAPKKIYQEIEKERFNKYLPRKDRNKSKKANERK